jgi:hypothetical protein
LALAHCRGAADYHRRGNVISIDHKPTRLGPVIPTRTDKRARRIVDQELFSGGTIGGPDRQLIDQTDPPPPIVCAIRNPRLKSAASPFGECLGKKRSVKK